MNQDRITKHHRRPKSRKGTGKPSNISYVKESQHRAFHTMFGNKHPEDIAEYLNAVWLDPDYYFICVRRRK